MQLAQRLDRLEAARGGVEEGCREVISVSPLWSRAKMGRARPLWFFADPTVLFILNRIKVRPKPPLSFAHCHQPPTMALKACAPWSLNVQH
jgi:hypothetical protein